MSVTAVREKDWVFNAFWVACGEESAPKCSVRIPITCMFREGQPFKTLGCDDYGIVKRIYLENVEMERTDADGNFRGQSLRNVRALRNLLLQYSLNKGYWSQQEENGRVPLVCSVSDLLLQW